MYFEFTTMEVRLKALRGGQLTRHVLVGLDGSDPEQLCADLLGFNTATEASFELSRCPDLLSFKLVAALEFDDGDPEYDRALSYLTLREDQAKGASEAYLSFPWYLPCEFYGDYSNVDWIAAWVTGRDAFGPNGEAAFVYRRKTYLLTKRECRVEVRLTTRRELHLVRGGGSAPRRRAGGLINGGL